MNTLRFVAGLGGLSLVASMVGCAAKSDVAEVAISTDEIQDGVIVQLPQGDPCRSVLGPLARAATESSVGWSQARRLTVTLKSETEDRDYSVFVEGAPFVVDGHVIPNEARFSISLSNDSASKCFAQQIKATPYAPFAPGATSPAGPTDFPSLSTSIDLPFADNCTRTLRPLATGLATSTGLRDVGRIEIELVSETEYRDYVLTIEGHAPGTNVPQVFEYDLKLDNDSSFMCFLLNVQPAGH